MSNIQIGRFGLDLTVDEVEQWDERGSQVTTGGVVFASSVAQAQHLRDQLLGLVNNRWEPVVPVVWSDDTNRTGFYRVRDVNVATDMFTLTSGLLPWKATLESVASYRTPLVDHIMYGANRTGKPGGLGTQPWHAIPGAWTSYDLGSTTPDYAYSVNLESSKTLGFYIDGSLKDLTAHTVPTAAAWYDGAATFYTGSSLYQVMGMEFVPDLSNWKVGNGVLEVRTPANTGRDMIEMRVLNTAGTTWSTWRGFRFGSDSAGWADYPYSNVRSIRLLRNSPECVAVRLVLGARSATASANYRTTIDLYLRRGARHVEAYVNTIVTSNYGWRLPACTTGASYVSVSNVSVRETDNDADGNRVWLSTFDAVNYSTGAGVDGRYSLTAVGAATSCALGIEVGGSGSAAPYRATDQEQQWATAVGETQRVVQP